MRSSILAGHPTAECTSLGGRKARLCAGKRVLAGRRAPLKTKKIRGVRAEQIIVKHRKTSIAVGWPRETSARMRSFKKVDSAAWLGRGHVVLISLVSLMVISKTRGCWGS